MPQIKTNISINQAVEANAMDRDRSKKVIGTSDKYSVKLRDEQGREYEIKYL